MIEKQRLSMSLGLLLLWVGVAGAAEPFRYPMGEHGKGKLKYHDGIPILHVQGSPAEIGEQIGALVLKPAAGLLKQKDELLEAFGLNTVFPVLMKTGNFMTSQFPPDHLKELEAMAKTSGWPRDLLVLANTIDDLKKLTSCSVLMVAQEKSATGGPLFGRNLDTPPFLPLHEYTFVAVYRPTGKRTFASVVYPGSIGCYSGINDAGLAIASLTTYSAEDGSIKFNPTGIPYTLAMRRILEECQTVEEAEKLIRSMTRTTMQNLAVCDKRHGVVFEITTRNLIVRHAQDGVCVCTNHFRSNELTGSDSPPRCVRYDTLNESRNFRRLTVTDVAKQLHAVNQGEATLQSMVFEPAALSLHLAIGKGPASALPMTSIRLEKLFAEFATDK